MASRTDWSATAADVCALAILLHKHAKMWDYGRYGLFALFACIDLVSVAVSFDLLARAYLVIESFVALPNSAPSVYQIPSWTKYFPHLRCGKGITVRHQRSLARPEITNRSGL